MSLDQPSMVLDPGFDNDDEDGDWGDRMDPITFTRLAIHTLPRSFKKHGQKMHERLDQEITNWAEGVRSVVFEG